MTPRNRSLFLERGHAYVYLAYGVSFMLNVSSEASGIGAGVLIRALEPVEGVAIMRQNRGVERLRDLTRGPGRLAQALRIDRSLDGLDLCRKARYGWRARATRRDRREESERASGSAFRGRRSGCCGFISGAARSSAARSRSTDETGRALARRRAADHAPPFTENDDNTLRNSESHAITIASVGSSRTGDNERIEARRGAATMHRRIARESILRRIALPAARSGFNYLRSTWLSGMKVVHNQETWGGRFFI